VQKKLEAKDVLPNISCMQAAERAEKYRFFPGDLTFKLFGAMDQTRLTYKFGANPFSSSGDILHTNKNHRLTAPKTEPSTVHCVR